MEYVGLLSYKTCSIGRQPKPLPASFSNRNAMGNYPFNAVQTLSPFFPVLHSLISQNHHPVASQPLLKVRKTDPTSSSSVPRPHRNFPYKVKDALVFRNCANSNQNYPSRRCWSSLSSFRFLCHLFTFFFSTEPVRYFLPVLNAGDHNSTVIVLSPAVKSQLIGTWVQCWVEFRPPAAAR